MLRDDGALLEIDLREHHVLAGDEAAAEQRLQLLARQLVPAVPGSAISHDPESMDRWATFDCYGTLIDWNGGIGRELERLFGPNEAGEKLRLYHELEPEIQREDPTRSYREVMALALARLGAPAGEHDALGRALPGWEPFPEVPAALEE